MRTSVGRVAATLIAPLRNLTTSNHFQDGTIPVNIPKITSPARPYRISFFLPTLSESLPIMGENIAEDRVKADMKIPTDATVAPREVMYIG